MKAWNFIVQSDQHAIAELHFVDRTGLNIYNFSLSVLGFFFILDPMNHEKLKTTVLHLYRFLR